jgi:hypothetical protein
MTEYMTLPSTIAVDSRYGLKCFMCMEKVGAYILKGTGAINRRNLVQADPRICGDCLYILSDKDLYCDEHSDMTKAGWKPAYCYNCEEKLYDGVGKYWQPVPAACDVWITPRALMAFVPKQCSHCQTLQLRTDIPCRACCEVLHLGMQHPSILAHYGKRQRTISDMGIAPPETPDWLGGKGNKRQRMQVTIDCVIVGASGNQIKLADVNAEPILGYFDTD